MGSMSILRIIRNNFISLYRVFKTYDIRLVLHMVYNRLRFRQADDFLKADRPAKFRFLHKHYGHLLEKCRKNPTCNKPNEGPIWVFWWQGKSNMPEIVHFCYESIEKNKPNDRPLILLDKNNLNEYIDIPDYIMDKLEKKCMTLIHFSDIVRMSLLSKHGGLWMDATVFLSNKLPSNIFDNSYFSCREPGRPFAVCKANYTVFMLGAAANAPWVVYARDFLYEYWKRSYKLLDYLLIDYILMMAFDSIDELREEVKKGVINTEHINTLQNDRNETCDPIYYQKMMSECSVYKLSYKLKYQERDNEGNLTYYGMMRSSARN